MNQRKTWRGKEGMIVGPFSVLLMILWVCKYCKRCGLGMYSSSSSIHFSQPLPGTDHD